MIFVLITLVLTLVTAIVLFKFEDSSKYKLIIPILLLAHLASFILMFMGYSMVEEYDKFSVNYSKSNVVYDKLNLSAGEHYVIKSSDVEFIAPVNRVEVSKTDDPEKEWVTIKGSRVIRTPRYDLLYRLNTLDSPKYEIVYHVEHVDIIKYEEK